MKRCIIFRLVLCLTVMICLNSFAFTAFGTTTYSCSEGKHEFESEIITINTEYEDGEVKNTCVRCGYIYMEELPATGHTFSEWTVVQEPTVHRTGIENRYCVGCGRVYRRTLPVLYSFLEEAKPEWIPNAMDYLLIGSVSGIWIYTFLMLWYNGLVLNWDRRERLKRKSGKETTYDRK